MRSLSGLILFFLICSTSFSRADVSFNDTHGQNISFSDLKGKWVLINYWASWCQTCIDEIPELNAFYEKHQKDSVALFAVNFDSLPLNEQNSLIKKFNIHYPNLIQDPASKLRLGDITGVPITFVFNPQGQLVKTLYGEQNAKTLDSIIKESKESAIG